MFCSYKMLTRTTKQKGRYLVVFVSTLYLKVLNLIYFTYIHCHIFSIRIKT